MKKTLIATIVIVLSLSSVFSETMTIDIDKAVKLLHQNNNLLKMGAINLKIAKRGNDTSWINIFNFDPSLDISSYTEMDNDHSDPFIPGSSFHIGASISMGIDFSIADKIKQSALYYEEEKNTYNNSLQYMEGDLKAEFYNLILLSEEIEILEKGLNLAAKRYNQTEGKFSRGLVSELEVLRTKIAYEKQRPGLSSKKAGYEKSLMLFKARLGLELDQEIIIEGSLNSDAFSFDKEVLLGKYMSNSLVLKNMNNRLSLWEHEKKITALSNYAPNLSFSYTHDNLLSYDTDTSLWNFEEEGGIGFGSFNINLRLSLDRLIPGLGINTEIKNIQDNINIQEINITNTIVQSKVEILNTVAELENTIERLEINKMNVELTRDVYERTENAYQQGREILLNVEISQKDLLEAEGEVLKEKKNYLIGIINLEYKISTSIDEIN